MDDVTSGNCDRVSMGNFRFRGAEVKGVGARVSGARCRESRVPGIPGAERPRRCAASPHRSGPGLLPPWTI